jgi:hypothetical protein
LLYSLPSCPAQPTHAAPVTACLSPPPAEDATLDFTDGSPSEAHTTAADFNQRSLIDVEEEIKYDDSEGEEEAEAASKAVAGKKGGGLLSNFVRSLSVNVAGTQVGGGGLEAGAGTTRCHCRIL